MRNIQTIGFGVLTLLLLTIAGYQLYTFYNYPCEAFKSGYLSTGYAPARCVE